MKWSNVFFGSLCVAGFMACSESGGASSTPEDLDVPTAPKIEVCTDDLSEEKLEIADASLKAISNNPAEVIAQDYGNLGHSQWTSTTDYSSSLNDFKNLLSETSGYCNGYIGKGIVYGLKGANQSDFKSFINQFELANDLSLDWKTKDGLYEGLYKLIHTTSTGSDLNWADFQSVVATDVYPQLDSAISYLSSGYNSASNVFSFSAEGNTINIDRSDIGPALGMLEIYKAVATVILSRTADANLDDSKEWQSVIEGLKEDDFTALSESQTAAINHSISLIEGENKFLGLNGDWSERLAAVPSLLESALEHVKGGFEYGISQYSNSDLQEGNPYRVGPQEDVSPTSLEFSMARIEDIILDLTTEKELSLDGDNTTRMNISKYFAIENLTSLAPYLKVNESSTWNNNSSFDTTFTENFPSDDAAEQAVAALGIITGGNAIFSLPDASGADSIAWKISRLNPDAPTNNVVVGYIKAARLGTCDFDARKEGSDTWTNLSIEDCKLEGEVPQFIQHVSAGKSAAFVFTNVTGVTTFDPGNQSFKDIEDLKGKITFPDPTMGGVFPDLTNDNIWETVSQLEEGFEDAQYDKGCSSEGSLYSGIGYEVCREGSPLFPTNPGDISYLSYLIRWIN